MNTFWWWEGLWPLIWGLCLSVIWWINSFCAINWLVTDQNQPKRHMWKTRSQSTWGYIWCWTCEWNKEMYIITIEFSSVTLAVNNEEQLDTLSNTLQIKSLTLMCHCISILTLEDNTGGQAAAHNWDCESFSQGLIFSMISSTNITDNSMITNNSRSIQVMISHYT